MERFDKNIIKLKDVTGEIEHITGKLRSEVLTRLNRRGAVVGISGGIDSSVTLSLAVRAFGKDKVLGVMLPEKDSSVDSIRLARELSVSFGVQSIIEPITKALDGFNSYERRDGIVKNIFPDYDPETWKMKIRITNSGIQDSLPPVFSLVILDKNGIEKTKRLKPEEFRQIEAASNFKQRCRMAMLYYHAERMHFAVIGTPNKHEVEQGFFVKYGDGGADIMPIAHLYKSQVYQLATELGIPQEIIERTPTTDTYSAEQTQEEFFYQLPFADMDLLWYGYENKYSPEIVAPAMNISTENVISIFKNFDRKKRTTEYLRMQPIR